MLGSQGRHQVLVKLAQSSETALHWTTYGGGMRARLIVASGLVFVACGKSEPAPLANASTAGSPAVSMTSQDQRLLAAATILLPPEGLTPDSLPDHTSRGAAVLTGYCSQCHALPSPAMHAAQDWPSTARRMWVRIDMLHGMLGVRVPTAGDRVAMLNYLIANSLKVADNLPPGPGREVFQAMCSRCHLLPDPRQHSGPDWVAVVMRMERNMERMKVSGVSNPQAQQIIGYLETASRR
jgi:cytochrome c2